MHAAVPPAEQQPVNAIRDNARHPITVVIYVGNDEDDLRTCLRSLGTQQPEDGFQVVVIADANANAAPAIVASELPSALLLREESMLGWAEAIRRYLADLSAGTVAILSAHCQACDDWVAAIRREVEAGSRVMTGRRWQVGARLIDRLHALSVHGEYLATTPGQAPFAWDDNLALAPDLLAAALPRSEVILTGGAGAVLLSRNLRKMGLTIDYRPTMKVVHRSYSWAELVSLWRGEMAVNSVAMKLADPLAPGGALLKLGPLGAAALAGKRLLQGIATMVRVRGHLGVSIPELALHLLLFGVLMVAYFVGLCEQLWEHRNEIRRRSW